MIPLLKETVHCKKATIVAVFFIYIMYLLTTGLIYVLEYKKREESVRKLKAFKLELEQRQFFILIIALLVQVITPVPFPVVMLYLYLLTYPVQLIGHFKEDKWLLRLIPVAIQLLFALILIFFVLINPWCRHYYFRFIVGEPPEDYVNAINNQINASGNTEGAFNAGN
jgi:hypothetical protein